MTKNKKADSRLPFGIRMLINTALVVFVLFCTISIITTQNSIAEKKKELAEITENVDVLSAQNEELSELIASDDISRYMEKLAVESGNYAYPDERRYYDTSRD